MSCAPLCTDTDVLEGIWRVSDQLHHLSAYLMVVTGIACCLLIAAVVLLFVNHR